MSDYHMHLYPHRQHPSDPIPEGFPPALIERYCEMAEARGVPDLGFTEHLYRFKESEPVSGTVLGGGPPKRTRLRGSGRFHRSDG